MPTILTLPSNLYKSVKKATSDLCARIMTGVGASDENKAASLVKDPLLLTYLPVLAVFADIAVVLSSFSHKLSNYLHAVNEQVVSPSSDPSSAADNQQLQDLQQTQSALSKQLSKLSSDDDQCDLYLEMVRIKKECQELGAQSESLKAGDKRHLESLTLLLNTFGSFPQLADVLEHIVNNIVSLVKANAQLRAQLLAKEQELLAKEQELNKCKQDYSSLAESLHRSGTSIHDKIHGGIGTGATAADADGNDGDSNTTGISDTAVAPNEPDASAVDNDAQAITDSASSHGNDGAQEEHPQSTTSNGLSDVNETLSDIGKQADAKITAQKMQQLVEQLKLSLDSSSEEIQALLEEYEKQGAEAEQSRDKLLSKLVKSVEKMFCKVMSAEEKRQAIAKSIKMLEELLRLKRHLDNAKEANAKSPRAKQKSKGRQPRQGSSTLLNGSVAEPNTGYNPETGNVDIVQEDKINAGLNSAILSLARKYIKCGNGSYSVEQTPDTYLLRTKLSVAVQNYCGRVFIEELDLNGLLGVEPGQLLSVGTVTGASEQNMLKGIPLSYYQPIGLLGNSVMEQAIASLDNNVLAQVAEQIRALIKQYARTMLVDETVETPLENLQKGPATKGNKTKDPEDVDYDHRQAYVFACVAKHFNTPALKDHTLCSLEYIGGRGEEAVYGALSKVMSSSTAAFISDAFYCYKNHDQHGLEEMVHGVCFAHTLRTFIAHLLPNFFTPVKVIMESTGKTEEEKQDAISELLRTSPAISDLLQCFYDIKLIFGNDRKFEYQVSRSDPEFVTKRVAYRQKESMPIFEDVVEIAHKYDHWFVKGEKDGRPYYELKDKLNTIGAPFVYLLNQEQELRNTLMAGNLDLSTNEVERLIKQTFGAHNKIGFTSLVELKHLINFASVFFSFEKNGICPSKAIALLQACTFVKAIALHAPRVVISQMEAIDSKSAANPRRYQRAIAQPLTGDEAKRLLLYIFEHPQYFKPGTTEVIPLKEFERMFNDICGPSLRDKYMHLREMINEQSSSAA